MFTLGPASFTNAAERAVPVPQSRTGDTTIAPTGAQTLPAHRGSVGRFFGVNHVEEAGFHVGDQRVAGLGEA